MTISSAALKPLCVGRDSGHARYVPRMAHEPSGTSPDVRKLQWSFARCETDSGEALSECRAA